MAAAWMLLLATSGCAARIASARSSVPEACPRSSGTHAASMKVSSGSPFKKNGLTQAQRPAFAQRGFAKCFQAVAHGVSQREVEAVVGNFFQLERAPHLEAEPATDEQEGDIIEGVRVAFAKFVGPDDERVVEQTAGASGFGRVGQLFRQVTQFAAEPLIDLHQLRLRRFLFVRLVRKRVVA